jgi:hypothetical protein
MYWSACLSFLENFRKGQRTVYGLGEGWLLGRYTLEPVSDSKRFQKFPKKKKDPQRFAKKT